MSIERSVQDVLLCAAERAEVFKAVAEMLERSSARAKENGDDHAYEVIEVELAKVRGLEKNWPR